MPFFQSAEMSSHQNSHNRKKNDCEAESVEKDFGRRVVFALPIILPSAEPTFEIVKHSASLSPEVVPWQR